MRSPVRSLAILFLLLAALGNPPPATAGEPGWRAGAGAMDITPPGPMWMAGYGSRSAPAEGTGSPLHAKALVLEDGSGNRVVLVSLDLVGIDRAMGLALRERAGKEAGCDAARVAVCTSHTHSGPVVGRGLGPLHYLVLDEAQQRLVDEYARALPDRVAEVVRAAASRLPPARLHWGSGHEGFAVNRRENKPEGEVPALRAKGGLAGPVDHDVPVLAVRGDAGDLLSVVFGYACHATVLSGQTWDGDYPGYAQAGLESAHPGCVALFWAGCGGDQNPLPRRDVALARAYGARLAAEVEDVLGGPMGELAPLLSAAYEEIALPLDHLPGRGDLEAAAASPNRFEVARAKWLRERLEAEGKLADAYPFPLGAWTLGDPGAAEGAVELLFLGGEVVVDYALRLKRERSGLRTWVAAYANDVMAYIPSRRVLEEGGYEGGGSNVYYGLPGLWHESAEEVLVSAAHRLAGTEPLAGSAKPAQSAP